MRAKWDLGLAGAISIANPVPVEDEIPSGEIGGLIDQALAECDERGIHGKDITPFLLGRIVELSGGRSLETNIAWCATTPGSGRLWRSPTSASAEAPRGMPAVPPRAPGRHLPGPWPLSGTAPW